MTDDLSLDHETVARQLAELPARAEDPWLARRRLGFGCSDLGALLLALDRRPADGCTRTLVEDARLLFQRKAAARPQRETQAMRRGGERERELLARWVGDGCPGTDVLPSTVRHSSDVPREWLPLVDRYEPRLLCTPDAWGRNAWGDLVAVELKTTGGGYARPWAHAVQVQGEVAAMNADAGVVVCGPGWAAGRDEDVVVWPIARDERLIDELRAACAEGWRRVEQLRGART